MRQKRESNLRPRDQQADTLTTEPRRHVGVEHENTESELILVLLGVEQCAVPFPCQLRPGERAKFDVYDTLTAI